MRKLVKKVGLSLVSVSFSTISMANEIESQENSISQAVQQEVISGEETSSGCMIVHEESAENMNLDTLLTPETDEKESLSFSFPNGDGVEFAEIPDTGLPEASSPIGTENESGEEATQIEKNETSSGEGQSSESMHSTNSTEAQPQDPEDVIPETTTNETEQTADQNTEGEAGETNIDDQEDSSSETNGKDKDRTSPEDSETSNKNELTLLKIRQAGTIREGFGIKRDYPISTKAYEALVGLVPLNDYLIGLPLALAADGFSLATVTNTVLHANSLLMPIVDAKEKNLIPAPVSYWKDSAYFAARSSVRAFKFGSAMAYMTGMGDTFWYLNVAATSVDAASGLYTMGGFFWDSYKKSKQSKV